MRTHRIISIAIAIAGLLGGSGFAVAQTATPAPPALPHVPLQKTIGQAGAADIIPSLIVMNSRGATLQGGKLTLIGVAPNSIVFADRPVRAAGHALTTHLLEEWTPGGADDDNFAKNPPNATISAFSKDGTAIRDAVIVMKTPKLEGDQLTFDVDVLEGDLTGADGAASVFIDRFGFARGGFGGVGRVGVGRVGVGRVGMWAGVRFIAGRRLELEQRLSEVPQLERPTTVRRADILPTRLATRAIGRTAIADGGSRWGARDPSAIVVSPTHYGGDRGDKWRYISNFSNT